MKFFLQYFLNFLARRVLRKYHPKIIGITGSVGKSSAKEAIFAVLSGRFNVRQNIKNYNNELGVPLTILGKESAGRSILRWLKIFGRGVSLIFQKDKKYPEILILEMGADKPGDIHYLTDLASCHVGVLTAIGPTHLEAFKTVRRVVQEKQIIVTHLKKDDLAVLNQDDDLVMSIKNKIDAEVITFGFNENSFVRGSDVKLVSDLEEGQVKIRGTNFKVSYNGAMAPITLPNVLGQQQAYAALAATAVGIGLGLNLVEIGEQLKNYKAPPSRMRVLEGIKYTTLIDDSYNSSPLAAQAALQVFSQVPVAAGARRLAVLGDMLELGVETEPAHQKVGRLVADLGIDYLVTVGERGKIMALAAQEKGLSQDKIFKFDKSESAGKFLQEKIEPEDVILIKGSQGVRMEKIVVELLANPLAAPKLVCRQDESWKRK